MTRLLASRLITAALTLGVATGAAAAGAIRPVDGQPPAPTLELTDMDGKVRSLSEFRGQVVAVNFWATWCAPCREEMPSMQRTYEALKDRGFTILAVDVAEDWDAVAEFQERLEGVTLQFPILLDDEGSTMGPWEIIGLPTTVIVDRRGRMTHRISGTRDWDDGETRAVLEALLDAGS